MQRRGRFLLGRLAVFLPNFRFAGRIKTPIIIGSALLLLAVQAYSCWRTGSLLLFCAMLIQSSLFLFLLSAFWGKTGKNALEIRLGSTFLNGFVVLLLCGHIFLESFDRLSAHPPAVFSNAWLAALLGLGGNMILYLMLSYTRFRTLRFGSFRPPIPAMIIAFGSIFMALVIIQLTGAYLFDSILSIPLGLSIFIWAGFVTIDSYWQILEFY